jgi:signal transduction histidine kinase
MNGVIGGTDLLLDPSQCGNLSREQNEMLTIIKTSGEAMLTIINDILDLSKIEAGRVELEPTAFSIRQCMESAVDVLASKAHSKGLEIITTASHEVPYIIEQDYKRLTQIFFNLLSNAVKFSDQGDVLITMHVVSEQLSVPWVNPIVHGEERDPAADSHFVLQFNIQDSGIGHTTMLPSYVRQCLPFHLCSPCSLSACCRACV